jgi:hypothetical protein
MRNVVGNTSFCLAAVTVDALPGVAKPEPPPAKPTDKQNVQAIVPVQRFLRKFVVEL